MWVWLVSFLVRCNGSLLTGQKEFQHPFFVHSHVLSHETPVLTVDTSHTVTEALSTTIAHLHVLHRTSHPSETLQQQFCRHRCTLHCQQKPVGFKGFQEWCVTWISFPFSQHSFIFYVHLPTETGQPFAIFRRLIRISVWDKKWQRGILPHPPFL